MTPFHRRNFLKYSLRTMSAAALGRLGALNAYAASVAPDYKALVCIFLAGGNDAHNTIIPIRTGGGDTGNQGFADYARVRPSSGIGLAQGDLLPIMVQNDVYGFHPSLKNIGGLYTGGKVAVLANVGNLAQPTTAAFYEQHIKTNDGSIPAQLFSHPDQIAQWQSAHPDVPSSTTGWAGRAADLVAKNGHLKFPMNITIGGGDALFGYGALTLPTSVTGLNPSDQLTQADTDAVSQLLTFDNGVQLVQAANKITAQAINDHTLLAQAISSIDNTTLQLLANRFNGLPGQLSLQLLTVAKIITASGSLGVNRQIFFVTQGGYDTHAAERGSVGQDGLLATLDKALNAFYLSTRDLGVEDRVTTFTNSEFGRNLQPNSTMGTDHAWGSHHFIIGGAVAGGKMFGTFPTLRVGGPDDLPADQGSGMVIPTTSIAEYGATLAKWFGVNPTNGDMVTVFPTLPKFTKFDPAVGLGFL